jgi:crotonobetainyl-CoA:carnitine CoA-transferase CaiB-like acyl-CoA transferase
MATNCEVMLENFRPDVIEKMALGYEQASSADPRLIFGRISGFGRNGASSDEPAFDETLQAIPGVMGSNGTPDGGPLRMGVPLGELGAGMWLAPGVVAAILQREATRRGQRVDTSLLATLTGMLASQARNYLNAGVTPTRAGNSHPAISPYGVFRATDQLIVIASATRTMWPRFCELIGLEDLIEPKILVRLQHVSPIWNLSNDSSTNAWGRTLLKAGRANLLRREFHRVQFAPCPGRSKTPGSMSPGSLNPLLIRRWGPDEYQQAP